MGNAPILRQTKFRLPLARAWHTVISFLRTQLSPDGGDGPLHLYLNSAFCPSPDDSVANLHRCFAIDGVLVVNYSLTPAWG